MDYNEEETTLCRFCGIQITYYQTEWVSNIDDRWRYGDSQDTPSEKQPWWICCPGSPEALVKYPTYGAAFMANDNTELATYHEPMDRLSALVFDMTKE